MRSEGSLPILNKGQTIPKANYGVISSSKKCTKKHLRENVLSDFRSFFGINGDTINCFRDFMTFSTSEQLFEQNTIPAMKSRIAS